MGIAYLFRSCDFVANGTLVKGLGVPVVILDTFVVVVHVGKRYYCFAHAGRRSITAMRDLYIYWRAIVDDKEGHLNTERVLMRLLLAE